ncbi:MAG: chorismate synthase [Omnitrophica bacterium RIFCSPHIGHO2_02_FULL_46_11]|nr:MAG: chorismate synthase [Omnitrophica bacterium RIFCSPHIGHO2_02_FULL_46_11]OGW87631.1 MAG: chorismate synthase [Omnitrophica bacterium RIFCSPLOWO2_01_FULL_45_10b]
MLQFLTCGESHGKYLTAILEGIPSGLPIDLDFINQELRIRQRGYGRGGRQKIENDKIEITGGVYKGKTTGAPVGLLIENKDVKIDELPQLFRPRPGHADLAGSLKYDEGIREILERASARETAIRVAVGAVSRLFLLEFSIEIAGHVIQIGKAKLDEEVAFDQILKRRQGSEVNCVSKEVEKQMTAEIQRAMKNKDTVGGKYEIRARGIPIGLGSHVHYQRKLDGRIAQALMSMQSVKAVEFGLGVQEAETFGSGAHDEIFYAAKRGFYHKTNRAGGITGGMSNGAEILVRATMKPISTLRRELRSVNMKTKKEEKADFERSDVCAVPAGCVIGEAIVAFEVADAMLEKFGGDSIRETKRNYKGYLDQLAKS